MKKPKFTIENVSTASRDFFLSGLKIFIWYLLVFLMFSKFLSELCSLG